jgi:hypothetical protein
MKTLVFLWLAVIIAPFRTLEPTPDQASAEFSKKITEAIRKGNSSELSSYFASTIDLTVPGKEGSFSKAQAEQIVKDFFTQNPPKSFTIKHNGSSNDGSQYSVGTYITAKSAYRSYFLIKNVSGKFYLLQLQFELD